MPIGFGVICRLGAFSHMRHHFIPIMHLKHFTGPSPKGQVWTYDAKTGDVRSATPENTAVERHFYSFEGADGTMDTRVEDYLASIENDAAPIHEGLLAGRIPPDDTQERADFSSFLAVMHVRTPAMRRIAGELMGRHIQIMAHAYGSDPSRASESLLSRAEKDGIARPDPVGR